MARKIVNRILIVLGIIGGAFIVVLIGMLISIFIIEGTEDYSRAQNVQLFQSSPMAC